MPQNSSTDSPSRWNVAPFFIVNDVITAANFYRDKLGFRYDRLWGEPPCFTIVVRSGSHIMLRQVGSPGFVRPNRTPDPKDFVLDAYIWVEGVDDLYAEFKRKDVKVVREICDQDHGCREFDVEDFDGYRLCFGQIIG